MNSRKQLQKILDELEKCSPPTEIDQLIASLSESSDQVAAALREADEREKFLIFGSQKDSSFAVKEASTSKYPPYQPTKQERRESWTHSRDSDHASSSRDKSAIHKRSSDQSRNHDRSSYRSRSPLSPLHSSSRRDRSSMKRERSSSHERNHSQSRQSKHSPSRKRKHHNQRSVERSRDYAKSSGSYEHKKKPEAQNAFETEGRNSAANYFARKGYKVAVGPDNHASAQALGLSAGPTRKPITSEGSDMQPTYTRKQLKLRAKRHLKRFWRNYERSLVEQETAAEPEMAAESEQATAATSEKETAATSMPETAAASKQKTNKEAKTAEVEDEFEDFEDYLMEVKAEPVDPTIKEGGTSSNQTVESVEIKAESEEDFEISEEEEISSNIAMEVNAPPKDPVISEGEAISNQSLTFGELEPASTSDWNFCMTLLNDLSKMSEQQKVSFRVKIEQLREETLKEFFETE